MYSMWLENGNFDKRGKNWFGDTLFLFNWFQIKGIVISRPVDKLHNTFFFALNENYVEAKQENDDIDHEIFFSTFCQNFSSNRK